jgi:hypothetical protein
LKVQFELARDFLETKDGEGRFRSQPTPLYFTLR